ncbi:MAG: DUF4783 domain-containing protein [Chitinophagales bacterium]
MKKVYLIFALSIAFVLNTNAQDFKNISDYFTNGDLTELSNALDEKVEVSILDSETYSKEEAKPVLKDFFSELTNLQYTPVHRGSSETDSFYQIGELQLKENSYRTYFYTKQKGTDFLVQEIRIEKK